MSKAPNLERQTSDSLNIPERRVVVKDPNELPLDYSTTPGGTIFSTTPGGDCCDVVNVYHIMCALPVFVH